MNLVPTKKPNPAIVQMNTASDWRAAQAVIARFEDALSRNGKSMDDFNVTIDKPMFKSHWVVTIKRNKVNG